MSSREHSGRTSVDEADRAISPAGGGRLLDAVRTGLLGGNRWFFTCILAAGIGLNLMAIWSVRWLPMCDLSAWIELMEVMGRHDDPSTIFSEIYSLPTGPQPNTLALIFAWLVVPSISARLAAHILVSLYIIGLPLSILALLRAFDRSKWLVLFSLPLSFNAMFNMGFVNFLIGMPLVFLAIALSRRISLDVKWWWGALLATCLVVLYFAHIFCLIVGWSMCLAVLVLSTPPRRYHHVLWPLAPICPLFCWWFWRKFIVLEPTQDGATFGVAEGNLFDYPGLDAHFSEIQGWSMQIFRDGSDDVFMIIIIIVWFSMVALAQTERGRDAQERGILAVTRRYTLEVLIACSAIVYFILPFEMNQLSVVAQRVIIFVILMLTSWPIVRFERWSQRVVLVPLVMASLAFPFLVRGKFVTFEHETVGGLPQAIASLPDRSRLAQVLWHKNDKHIHRGVVWHLAQGMHAAANGGHMDNSFAKRPHSAIQYRKGMKPKRLPRKFWRSPDMVDYDYILLRALYEPREALEQTRRIRLIFNEGEWYIFEVLKPRGPDARKSWARERNIECEGAVPMCGANIVLIVVDTLRFDHVGFHGYARSTSPRMDAMAARSVVFEKAYSHAPWTHPSVTSIFTSMHPKDHGVTQWQHKVKPERVMLSEVLYDSGYLTQAIVSHLLFKPIFGYRQGFDHYDFSVLKKGDPHGITSSEEVSDAAIVALEGAIEPFFLWLHYFDPHSDYINHEAFDFPGDKPMDWYDSEIAFTDHHIGRVIDKLEEEGLLDRTIVVLASDHGEEFWEHGGRYHAGKVYEESIRVPLLFWIPGVEHRRVKARVVLSDIAPTILSLIGLPIPPEFQGSVLPLGPEADGMEDRTIFTETRRKGNKRSIIKDGYKLIFNVGVQSIELYDLQKDPGETMDLSSAEESLSADLLSRILEFYGQAPEEPEEFELGPELTSKLQSLGYLR